MQKNGKKLLAWMLSSKHGIFFFYANSGSKEKACFIKEKSGNNCGENLNA